MMKEVRGRYGYPVLESRALWAPLYEAVLSNFGASAIILPLGDTRDENAGRTTCTTRRNSATGVNAVFTYSEAVSGFDAPPAFTGPAQIPVITFNGTDERLTSPDADYWTAASGALSLRVWCRVDAIGGANRSLFTKGYPASVAQGEWLLLIGGDSLLVGEIADVTAGARIRRNDSTAITLATWLHVVMTYDGGTAATGIKLYINGTQTDDASGGAGVFADMRNQADTVMLASDQSNSYFDGSFAGGPLGPCFSQTEWTADQILRDYALGRSALGI